VLRLPRPVNNGSNCAGLSFAPASRSSPPPCINRNNRPTAVIVWSA